MIGFNRYFVSNEKAEAFRGLLLGVTNGKVGFRWWIGFQTW